MKRSQKCPVDIFATRPEGESAGGTNDGFKYSFIIWSIINWYDAIVLDCIWFCHSKQFIIAGTEDMTKEYHNYWFHIKGSIIGELIGFIVCLIVGLIVSFL